jgi:hypothetical protein
MSGAIPPLPQYAFMEWCSVKKTITGTILPFLLYLYKCLSRNIKVGKSRVNLGRLGAYILALLRLEEDKTTDVLHV